MTENDVVCKIGRKNLQIIEATVRKGYSLADEVMRSNLMFEGPTVKYIAQDIRNLAVNYCLQQVCESGILPMAVTHPFTKRNTYRFVEVSNGNAILTHSSVTRMRGFPIGANFREGYAFSNQTTLDPDLIRCDDPDMIYGIVTHLKRGKSPSDAYVSLGVPDAEYGYWHCHIPLAELGQITVSKPVTSERDDFEISLREAAKTGTGQGG